MQDVSQRPSAMTIQVDTSRGLSNEHARLSAADLILRVLALTKKRESRKALVRLTQLNALITDYPHLVKSFPGILVFINFGRHYCTNPNKIKRKALLFMSMKAEPVIESIFATLESYLADQQRFAQLEASRPEAVNSIKEPKRVVKQPDHKFTTIGLGLENLKRVMPAIIEAEEKQKRVAAEEVARQAQVVKVPKIVKTVVSAAEPGVISSDDAYILEHAGKTKTRELSSGQSGIVRASIILTNSFVSEIARRFVTVEYGMQRVLGGYMLMTEAMVVGVARHNELGEQRDMNEIVSHAKRIVALRNDSRKTQGREPLGLLFSQGSITKLTAREKMGSGCVNTPTHAYFLLFNNRFIVDSQITCKRWEFYKKPGSADVQLTGN